MNKFTLRHREKQLRPARTGLCAKGGWIYREIAQPNEQNLNERLINSPVLSDKSIFNEYGNPSIPKKKTADFAKVIYILWLRRLY
jgi:hypothetical protein